MNAKAHIYTARALVGWLVLRSAAFIPGTHFIGGWVDLRTSLDTKEWRKISTPSDTQDRTRAVHPLELPVLHRLLVLNLPNPYLFIFI